ncbi:MAG: aminotransferase class I/II-fold pyridoxal phosphate-dependent enzyme [Chloroflexi bacterium]|nr:MAG: aminotransferase class I/II-fold pyridoxal phosphate-dependent enzyme [Chloroflexota bacterium]
MTTSKRLAAITPLVQHVIDFAAKSSYALRQGDPNISDFVFGNPHELALPSFVQALQRAVVPRDKNWFAYTMTDPTAARTVADSLRRRLGLEVETEDVFLTNGAFTGLSVVLQAIVDPGDEVIFVSPPWFFYEPLIVWAGATPVRVRVDATTLDLDVAAIERAITPRTRAIVVNTPNNPTGRVYPANTLEALARVLTVASERHGRTIYVLSDEAYRRIIFDGRAFATPARFYPNTFVIYTYGKQLLTPGQRLGYVALPSAMPDREGLRGSITLAQILSGWGWPNALLQHALPELEEVSIDIGQLQRKRDRLVGELWRLGYEVHVPEGTFYLLPRSPLRDDLAFTEILARNEVFVMPGTVVEMPGYFRISLTANDAMIERAVSGFASAIGEAKRLPVATR